MAVTKMVNEACSSEEHLSTQFSFVRMRWLPEILRKGRDEAVPVYTFNYSFFYFTTWKLVFYHLPVGRYYTIFKNMSLLDTFDCTFQTIQAIQTFLVLTNVSSLFKLILN